MNILILGSDGMVGRSLCNYFSKKYNVIPVGRNIDLTKKDQLLPFINNVTHCIIAAGKVGGIKANQENQIEFTTVNMKIAIECLATLSKKKIKTLYLSSSCIYPKNCIQPMSTESLLSGPIEKTNEGYALAKITGIKLCQYYRNQFNDDFISCIPASLYGPYDNFHSEDSHVLPALIRKFSTNKEITLWGTGNPVREFLHVDDFSKACHILLENYSKEEPINVGIDQGNLTQGTRLKELAEIIKKKTNFIGEIKWDTTKPDGMPYKILNSSKIHEIGWEPSISLEEGLENTINWTKENNWCFNKKYNLKV